MWLAVSIDEEDGEAHAHVAWGTDETNYKQVNKVFGSTREALEEIQDVLDSIENADEDPDDEFCDCCGEPYDDCLCEDPECLH